MEETRHIFIVNPAAGRGENERIVRSACDAYFSVAGGEYAVRVTSAPLHAMHMAREEAEKGGLVRLYACGGDGTLCEVVNGAAGHQNASLTVLPIGSGNDFVKSFGRAEDFLDIGRLVNGREVCVDLIRVDGRYALNLCSMGFDAEVAIHLTRFRGLPLVPGFLAYHLSVSYCLFKKIQSRFDIVIDDQTRLSGRFLLCAIANGQWYGGGYHAAPQADPADGVLDFVVVNAVGRIGFIKMVNKYRKGEHDGLRPLRHLAGKKLEISSPTPVALNCDGECTYVRRAVFEVVPGALRFAVPEGCMAQEELVQTYKVANNIS